MKNNLYIKVLVSIILAFALSMGLSRMFFLHYSPAPDSKSIAEFQQKGKSIIADAASLINEVFSAQATNVPVPTLAPQKATSASQNAAQNTPAKVEFNNDTGAFIVTFQKDTKLKSIDN